MTRNDPPRAPGDCRRSPCLTAEDERAAVVRAGRVKLGVELEAGARIGEKKTADRGSYVLCLADYAATIRAGVPAVPQPDDSVDPGTPRGGTPAIREPWPRRAARGSLCAQVFLEDNSKKRLAAGESS